MTSSKHMKYELGVWKNRIEIPFENYFQFGVIWDSNYFSIKIKYKLYKKILTYALFGYIIAKTLQKNMQKRL